MKRTKERQKQVIEQRKKAKTSAQLELEAKMAYCYGTEHYYTDSIICYTYTDGVRTFVKEAGAGWLLTEFNKFIYGQKEFCSLKLVVKDNKADILKDGKKVKHIAFTDCPDGEWEFFYEPNGVPSRVLMWNGEY